MKSNTERLQITAVCISTLESVLQGKDNQIDALVARIADLDEEREALYHKTIDQTAYIEQLKARIAELEHTVDSLFTQADIIARERKKEQDAYAEYVPMLETRLSSLDAENGLLRDRLQRMEQDRDA